MAGNTFSPQRTLCGRLRAMAGPIVPASQHGISAFILEGNHQFSSGEESNTRSAARASATRVLFIDCRLPRSTQPRKSSRASWTSCVSPRLIAGYIDRGGCPLGLRKALCASGLEYSQHAQPIWTLHRRVPGNPGQDVANMRRISRRQWAGVLRGSAERYRQQDARA